jgi:hypothetical protein
MPGRIKNITIILLVLVCFGISKRTGAQSYFGYQTIGKHTFLFSLAWQGEIKLGFSYIYRNYSSGNTFSDIQGEVRFPLREMYTCKNYEVIAGVYKPLSVSRTFLGIGGHLRFEKETIDNQRTLKLSPALTVLPSVTYVSSLDDGPYGTMGLRLTYAPVAYLNHKVEEEQAQKQAFSQHLFEGGLHIDLHLERTLGLGLDVYTKYNLYPEKSILPEEEDWEIEGNFWLGATYNLER